MSYNTKMALFIVGVALMVIACAGVWWLFFSHRMNPQLPETTVQISGVEPGASSASGDGSTIPAGTSSLSVATSAGVQSGENPHLATESLKIRSTTFTVEIASTMLQKNDGLSFRPDLAPGHGMIFLFSSPGVQGFWMKDMNFALDMIWIGNGKVLGFTQNAAPQPGAQPWQLKIYSSPKGTDTVLEVPAGTVASDDIRVGDSVVISE